jgi:hypothetical protein
MLPETSRRRRGRGCALYQPHIIRVMERAFDDFASGGTDKALLKKLMGI